ncbi:MAG: tetratricopeptide repeat protein [Umezawaea sp.]
MFGRFRKRAERQAEQQPEPHSEQPEFTVTQLPSVTAARQAAAGGSPVEMNRLGNNLKVKGQEDEAAEWYRKAADAGNTDAMANLAMYLMGKGRNAEAAKWFRRAGGPLGEALANELDNPDGR